MIEEEKKKVVEEEGQKVTKLRLFGMSRKKIPQVPLLRTKLVKASRASSQWPPPGEGLHLKDNDEDDVQLERDGVFVIGMGGIVVDAKVCAQHLALPQAPSSFSLSFRTFGTPLLLHSPSFSCDSLS